MKNKIALFVNDSGMVDRIHYRPELLPDDQIKHAFLIGKNDERLTPPVTEPWEDATMLISDGELVWGKSTKRVDSVHAYKLKIQLKREWLYDAVVDAIRENEEMQIAFDHAPEIRRQSETVITVAKTLDIPDETVDLIFAKANAIEL